MSYSTLSRNLLLSAAIFASVSALHAVPTAVISRAALGGNDSINWASEGVEFDYLGTSFGAASAGGLGATVSGSEFGFERADQSSSWNGNFAAGDALLWTGFGSAPQTITIQFASGVLGAGAQIQNDFLSGAFVAFLNVYDTGGVLLDSFAFSGNSTSDGDNSAIFIGVRNDVANIGKIELGVSGSESFAINQLDLVREQIVQPVPEGGAYLSVLMLSALFGMGICFRTRPARA